MSKFLDNKRLFSQIVAVYTTTFVAVVLILAIASWNNINTSLLVDDPSAAMDY
ncbi:MAG: hypothetical protein ACLFV6_02205 [Spirulinaceae cyanobacterium]